ncbi:MAG: hypothetical protein OEY89_04110 [Gammaproteobacteria bacterium]|nr:hypothetical protein [Gammaproteobacteria bacterium]
MPRSITLSLKIALVAFLIALLINLFNANKPVNTQQSHIQTDISG